MIIIQNKINQINKKLIKLNLKYLIQKYKSNSQLIKNLTTITSINQSNTINNPSIGTSSLPPLKEFKAQQIFIAPNGRPIKLVKGLSSFTSILGITTLPLFYTFWDTEFIQNSELSWSIVIGACIASLSSTAFLHLVAGHYVRSVYLYPPPYTAFDIPTSITNTNLPEPLPTTHEYEKQILTPNTFITFETSNIIGQSQYTTVKLKDLKLGKLPNVTWSLKKNKKNKTNLEITNEERLKLKEEDEFNQIQVNKFWVDLIGIRQQGAYGLFRIDRFLRELEGLKV